MMELLFLLLLFQLKHYYADFVIQTYDQTVRKGIYRDLIGISHSVDHIWTSLLVLFIYSNFYYISVLTILIVCLLEGILHYHIDWAKVHYGCKDITKPTFWNQFGMDQLAHQLTYIVMAWYLVLL